MDSQNGMQMQMFRYAQDLQELMAQQTSLQKRYQLLLHSLGQGSLSDDPLPAHLLESVALHLVTNAQGEILRASAALAHALLWPAGAQQGRFIQPLMAPEQAASLPGLLATLTRQCALQRRQLVWLDGLDPSRQRVFDTLIMAVQKNGQLEIYWLMGQEVQPGDRLPAIENAFPLLPDSDEGCMVVHATGDIQAVNAAISRITGYRASELVGNNPSTFSSDLHDADFYPALWQQLNDTGCWTGELFNRRKNGQVYLSWETIKAVRDEQGDTLCFVASVADMSPGQMDNRQLTRLAFYDHLTGLSNRRMLEDRLKQSINACQEGDGLCVLLLDLDRFKPINDELGHDVGDLVLQTVGTRLAASVRRMDTCARLGGDEFVVVLHNTVSDVNIEKIASGILMAIAAPIKVGQRELSVEVSIGCARYPQDAQDLASLLKCADAAMYGAKRFGTKFSFYKDNHD
jgi:diguanylate cyclase (GGDEF)-like protein/PAS domain S-box-containing protein